MELQEHITQYICRRRRAQNTIVIISNLCRPALLALLLIIGEWALRVRHRRSELNEPAEGLRPETRQIEPDELADHVRVVALGDSITHGMDLSPKETYPSVLAEQLGQYLGSRPVTVINAGIAGQTAVQALQRVRRDVIRYQPHVTLIEFGLNDASLRRRQQDAQREREAFPAGLAAILNHLHLYRTIRTRTRRMAVALGLGKLLDYDGEPANEPRSSPGAYRSALRELVKQIRWHTDGQVLLLTTHQVNSHTGGERGDNSGGERQSQVRAHYNGIVRSVADELGAGLIDVEGAVREGELARFLQSDGVHLTGEGQRWLAGFICELIIERGLLSTC